MRYGEKKNMKVKIINNKVDQGVGSPHDTTKDVVSSDYNDNLNHVNVNVLKNEMSDSNLGATSYAPTQFIQETKDKRASLENLSDIHNSSLKEIQKSGQRQVLERNENSKTQNQIDIFSMDQS